MSRLWQKNIREITPYVPGEQPETADIIKLNANENPYPPSPAVQEALAKFQAGQLKYYPNANAQPLVSALAERHNLEENQIFVGNGSDDVLALAFLSFFASQTPILFPDISYSFYPVWCALFQIPYKTPALSPSFHIRKEDYFAENGGIILPNPNAPTGIGEDPAWIEDILIKNPGSIVIIDEAYADFAASSVLPLIRRYDNLLVVHTFSKSRSLAGIRIGAAFGNQELIAVLNAVKNSYNSYTMDSLAIALGVASVKDDAYFRETIKKVVFTRERFQKALLALGFTVCPSQSNFLFAAHPAVDAKELFHYLREHKIFIRYFQKPRIEQYLRITIGTDQEMELLLSQITKYLKQQQP